MKLNSLRESFWTLVLPIATVIVVGLVHQGGLGPSGAGPIGASATPSPTGTRPPATTKPISTLDARQTAPPIAATPAPRTTPEATPTARSSALDAWIFLPVSKDSGIPESYEPEDLVELGSMGISTCYDQPMHLREQAAMALAEMFDAARGDGHTLSVCSAYRSYAVQVSVHRMWVEDEIRQAEESGAPISEQEAETRANRYSALAGHSEHQLGTAVDISSAEVGFDLVERFGSTPGGRWLAENAHRYGFAFSYPTGKEELTGYVPEPWHLRWIGRSAALDLFEAGYLDPSTSATLTAYLVALSAQ